MPCQNEIKTTFHQYCCFIYLIAPDIFQHYQHHRYIAMVTLYVAMMSCFHWLQDLVKHLLSHTIFCLVIYLIMEFVINIVLPTIVTCFRLCWKRSGNMTNTKSCSYFVTFCRLRLVPWLPSVISKLLYFSGVKWGFGWQILFQF